MRKKQPKRQKSIIIHSFLSDKYTLKAKYWIYRRNNRDMSLEVNQCVYFYPKASVSSWVSETKDLASNNNDMHETSTINDRLNMLFSNIQFSFTRRIFKQYVTGSAEFHQLKVQPSKL